MRTRNTAVAAIENAQVQSTQRRTAILLAAARLFAQKGVEATTVREIARDVGVLSGSLYHHFPSKDAIAFEVVHNYLSDLLSAYREVLAHEQRPRRAFRALVAASLLAAHRHPYATDVYQRERARFIARNGPNELAAATDEVQQTWLRVLDRGQEAGEFRRDVPVWMAYRMTWDALFHSAPGAASAESTAEHAELLASLVLDGVGTATAAPIRRQSPVLHPVSCSISAAKSKTAPQISEERRVDRRA
jgi:AcrR family transcriptional regulator